MNRWIKVLQTSALPLGYAARIICIISVRCPVPVETGNEIDFIPVPARSVKKKTAGRQQENDLNPGVPGMWLGMWLGVCIKDAQ